MEPVCSSFSPARRHKLTSTDIGPRHLRSPEEPYGLRNPDPPFTSTEKVSIKLGNLFAKRACLFARAAYAQGIGSAIESPDIIFDDQASVFQFEEAKQLINLGAVDFKLDQCMFGAISTKPTCFRVLLPDKRAVDCWAGFNKRCNHPLKWHPVISSKGVNWPPRWTYSAHPRLTGKRTSGFATKVAQVYPLGVNQALAEAMVNSARFKTAAAHKPRCSSPRITSPIDVTLSLCPMGRKSLLQRSKTEVENENYLGGMRSPVIALASRPSARIGGASLWSLLDSLLSEWDLPNINSAADLHEKLFSSKQIKIVQDLLRTKLGADPQWKHSHSPIRGDLLAAIARILQDPDEVIASWFQLGAGTPMGIEEVLPHTGIFPPVPDDRASPYLSDLTHHDWRNYASAESEPTIVKDIIGQMKESGWLQEFVTLDEVARELSDDNIYVSKVALISKIREDGTAKHRLIWDLLRSEVNSLATQGERIILPES